MTQSVEIPRRVLFRAAEVCEIAQVQPYVLRTWEAEFPELGTAPSKDGARVYRRTDLERVLRLKQLLFVDGLTLAGARRKLADEGADPAAKENELLPFEQLLTADVRQSLAEIKGGLRAILEQLSKDAGANGGLAPARFPSRVDGGRRPAPKRKSQRGSPKRKKIVKARKRRGRSARA